MKSRKPDLTQDDVMTWAMYVGGLSHTAIAKALKCHHNTVANRLKKIGEWMAEKFDIAEFRLPLYALYPHMVASVLHNLKKCDVSMTLGVMRGLQILVDKTEQTGDWSQVTDDELRRRIRDAIGFKRPEENAVDSGRDRVGTAAS